MLLIRLGLLFSGLCFRGSSGESSKSFHLKRHHFNKRLVGYISKNASNLVIPECARTCMLLPECRSLNYDGETQFCEHNTVNSTEANSTAFTTDIGWMFSDVSEWPKEIAGTCADNQCGRNRLCLPTTPTYTCILDCWEPPHYSHAILTPVSATERTIHCPTPNQLVYNSTVRCSEDREGDVIWQPKENTTLCSAPDMNICKTDANCTGINGVCLDGQCTCPYDTAFSTGIQSCAPVFTLETTMGKYAMPNITNAGLVNIQRNGKFYNIMTSIGNGWKWRRTPAICSIINPEYRFGGTWQHVNTGEYVESIEISECSNETTFKNCGYRFGSDNERIGITCYTTHVRGMIRLSQSYYENSSNPHYRLEIQFNGEWGSVCADSKQSWFNPKIGRIACQSLQKSNILSSCRSCAGGPGGPFAVHGFLCYGDEPHLLYCGIYRWNPGKEEFCRRNELGLTCLD